MTNRFVNPIIKYTTINLNAMPGAELYFYITGTTTLKTIYQDFNGTIPHTNPVVALSDGHFPPIFLDGTYRVELKYLGVTQPGWPVDDIGATNDPAPLADWNSGFSYSEGDLVTGPDGNRYQSLQDNNLNNDPTVLGSLYWSQVFLGGNVDTWEQLDVAARSGAGPKADAESAIRYALDLPQASNIGFVRTNTDGTYTNRTISEAKTDLALNNVNNTSDVNKPVSTAQQSALDLKANINSPTFTGDPKTPTAAVGDASTLISNTFFVNRAVSDKARFIDNCTDLPATTAIVEDVVIARQYSSLGIGGGTFEAVSSSGLTIDNVKVFGSASSGVYFRRINYSILDVTMAGVLNNGTLSDTALQRAVTAGATHFPPGSYNFSVYPTGIDGANFSGSSLVTFTNKVMPLFNGIFAGNRKTAIVAGVIRYYDASGPNPAGWYFLKDKGEDHDPILCGPITDSGEHSQELAVNVDDFGLNPAIWTPAGFVVGADDDYAREGVTIGPSVGSSTIILKGSFNSPSTTVCIYDGTSWSYSGASGGPTPSTYTFAWNNGGTITATLRVTRTSGARGWRMGGYTAVDFLLFRKSKTTGVASYIPVFVTQGTDGDGNTYIDMYFEDSAGVRLQNLNNNVQFIMQDVGSRNTQLRWKDIQTPTTGNIWFAGFFSAIS